MENHGAEPVAKKSPGNLSRARLATFCAMAFERLWPRLLPLLLLVTVFASLSWFGLFRGLPDLGRWTALGVLAVCAIASLFPLLSWRFPRHEEVAERIEAANRLLHQPIAVQSDRPSGAGDPVGQALWLEHQRRMAAQLAALSPDLPRPQVPKRDPFALRAVPVLLAVIALGFSIGGAGGGLTDILHGSPPPETIPPRVDAWLTPPAYTGRAPVFMTSDANKETRKFAVPANSELTLRVTGGSGSEVVKLGGAVLNPANGKSGTSVQATPVAVLQPLVFKAKLQADITLQLLSGEQEVGNWQFRVIPDMPPKVEFADNPGNGLSGALTLSYRAVDDYGIANGKAVIAADKQLPGARPLFDAPEIKLAAPRRASKDGLGKSEKDLGEHPWAGTPVTVTLSVTDAANQEGRSSPVAIKLPERIFSHPLARAVVEHRRLLAMDANRKSRVLELLDALTLRPDDTVQNPSHFLGLHTARARLLAARNDDELRDVVAYLWQIANGIENSGLSEAQKRLKEAQEKLAQALENGASDAEIEKLMRELRSAMQGVMREFAEQARKNPNMAKQLDPNDRVISQSELDEMLKKLEDLAKQGARDQAKELLSQLNEMMNNLQAGRGQQPGGENGNAMNEQLNKLGEMMRQQQELMDQTQRLQQGRSGENGQGQGSEGEQGQNGQSFGDLQGRQGELRRDLQGMMDALRGLGLDPGEEFGKAGESMGNAENNLGQGEGGEALTNQSDALDALRKGGQGLMNQMQEAMGREGGGSQEGQRDGMADRDPLGRPRSTTGPDFGLNTKVPDDIDIQRAREILEAIRKRLGNVLSPELEKRYLERLLNLD